MEDFRENLRNALMHFVFVGRTQLDRKWGWWAGDADKVTTRYMMDGNKTLGWFMELSTPALWALTTSRTKR